MSEQMKDCPELKPEDREYLNGLVAEAEKSLKEYFDWLEKRCGVKPHRQLLNAGFEPLDRQKIKDMMSKEYPHSWNDDSELAIDFICNRFGVRAVEPLRVWCACGNEMKLAKLASNSVHEYYGCIGCNRYVKIATYNAAKGEKI